MDFDPLMSFKALSHNGRYAVLWDLTGYAMLDVATGLKLVALRGRYGDYLFSSDDSTLVVYAGDALLVWAIPSGKLTRQFKMHPNEGSGDTDFSLALSPDKTVLAVGQFTDLHTVGLISLESGKDSRPIRVLPRVVASVLAVAFSPDGRMIATDSNTPALDFRDQPVKPEPVLKLWRVPASR